MTEKARVGLIGIGKIGWVHPENLAFCISPAELAAMSDAFVEAAGKYAANYQIPTLYNDHCFTLADNSMKAVLTCSSADTHLILPPFLGQGAGNQTCSLQLIKTISKKAQI